MSKRLELHDILIDLLGTRGEKDTCVYFQPPSTVKMSYPCIVYRRNRIDTNFSNDVLYNHTQAYTVTVIDKNPDSEILNKVLHLPYCQPDRHYTADNLNHDVFIVYY
jgi:hypothetical protein